jgi:hypothetical protein
MTIIYRTAGPWGAGKGANLVAGEIDGNFHDLDARVGSIKDNIPAAAVGIAFFAVTPPNLFYVHMTNGTIQGPFALPQLAWNFRNVWLPSTAYAVNDVITANGSTYMVLINHISAATFDPGSNDGSGNNFYGLLLANPANMIPDGGLPGQYLTKTAVTDFAIGWQTPTVFPAQQLLEAPSATYTLTLANIASYVRCVNASGCTIVIPNDSTLSFPVSNEISFRQCTNAGITLTADVGVQFNLISGYSARTAVNGAVVTAKKIAANTWDIFGLLAT